MPFVHTTQTFIKKAKEVHGNKYNYSNVIYVHSLTPVIIECIHGTFTQKPKHHLKGNGCRMCADEFTEKTFIEKSKEVHGTEHYDYSLVIYENMSAKVIIICNIHKNNFEQKPSAHIQGSGCLLCSNEKRWTTEKFINFSKEKYPDKFDYRLTKYIDTKSDVTLICTIHNKEFDISANYHIKGGGCPDCAYENSSKLRTRSTEDFIILCRKIHGNTYNYNNVEYVSADTKVSIGCYNHIGEITYFEQRPHNHLQGQGCPLCHTHKNEEKCRDIIENLTNNVFSKGQPSFLGKMSYDCYNETLKLALEYDGEQHFIYYPDFFHKKGYHVFEEQQKRDVLKTQLSVINDIFLIRVRYDEKDKESI